MQHKGTLNRLWPRDTLPLLAKHLWSGGALDSQRYVDWAVMALVDGFDTPSLTILAGLDLGVSYHGDRYTCFRESIKELGINVFDTGRNIFVEFSGFVCRGLLSGDIDVEQALSLLYDCWLHNCWLHSCWLWSDDLEPFLTLWSRVDDDISATNEGCGPIYDKDFCAYTLTKYVMKVARQVITLLEIPLPRDFFSSSICNQCGFLNPHMVLASQGSLFCPRCGSQDIRDIALSLRGRETYLLGLEHRVYP